MSESNAPVGIHYTYNDWDVWVYGPFVIVPNAVQPIYSQEESAWWYSTLSDISGENLYNDSYSRDLPPAGTPVYLINDSSGSVDPGQPPASFMETVTDASSDSTNGDTMTEPDLNNHHNPSATENQFTGLHPDNSYPLVDGELDFEQQKRLQARQESDRTPRVSSDDPYDPHPPFTEKGPDATLAEQLAAEEG